jgi:protein-serine/threonine kinase
MLAGHLPWDATAKDYEHSSINDLYTRILNTPLGFPEYVTPKARDLLRRILIPDPCKRADLRKIARHSWLSRYSHVVAFITA